jgi:hypothetical protein
MSAIFLEKFWIGTSSEFWPAGRSHNAIKIQQKEIWWKLWCCPSCSGIHAQVLLVVIGYVWYIFFDNVYVQVKKNPFPPRCLSILNVFCNEVFFFSKKKFIHVDYPAMLFVYMCVTKVLRTNGSIIYFLTEDV